MSGFSRLHSDFVSDSTILFQPVRVVGRSESASLPLVRKSEINRDNRETIGIFSISTRAKRQHGLAPPALDVMSGQFSIQRAFGMPRQARLEYPGDFSASRG
jgi:hypothetical protein